MKLSCFYNELTCAGNFVSTLVDDAYSTSDSLKRYLHPERRGLTFILQHPFGQPSYVSRYKKLGSLK